MATQNNNSKAPTFWQRWRAEGALSNRYLPLRIWYLVAKLGGALVAAAFTLPALWGHYSGLVEGYPMIGQLGSGFPELVMIGLVFLAVFSGYDKTSSVANGWYKVMLISVLVHAGLIYSSSFVDKQLDKKIKEQVTRRKELAAELREDESQRAAASAEIRTATLQKQVDDIRSAAKTRAAELRARGNAKGASWVETDAEARITKLYASMESSALAPPSDVIKPVDENEIRGEMSKGWLASKVMKFKEYEDAYLSSFFAILVPFCLASCALLFSLQKFWDEGKHEIAAGGHLRQPADKKAYNLAGTNAPSDWQAQAPVFLPQGRTIGYLAPSSGIARTQPEDVGKTERP